MKRAAKTKRVKRVGSRMSATLSIAAPHTFTAVSFDFDKIATKKWPPLLRQLADAIESGELTKELENFAGCHMTAWPAPKSNRARKS